MPRTVAQAGVTLAFSVAYESAAGGLVLPVRITNRTAKDTSVRSDTYIQPDGRELDDLRGVNSIPFAPEVSAGAYVLDLVVVQGGRLGGTLVLDLNNYQRKVRVKVPQP